MDPLQRYRIEAECAKLPLLYAEHADMGDYAALAALFGEDGIYIRPFQADDPLEGRAQIHASFRDRSPTLARHLVTNVLIEVIDERRARGTNYLTVMSNHGDLVPPQESRAVYVGECDDEYRKTDQGWRFASRVGTLVLHIGGELPGGAASR